MLLDDRKDKTRQDEMGENNNATGGTLWPCPGDSWPPVHGAAHGFLYLKVSIDSLDYLSFVIRKSV